MTPTRFFGCLAGVALIVALIFAFTQGSSKDNGIGSTPSSPASLTNEGQGRGELPPDLKQRVIDFLEAYYLIKPDDTEATRRGRVAPFVSPDLLSRLDLGLSEGTEADKARKKDRLALTGTVTVEQLSSEPYQQGQATVNIVVPVVVSGVRGDGTTIENTEAFPNSTWQSVSGQWVAVDFSEGG